MKNVLTFWILVAMGISTATAYTIFGWLPGLRDVNELQASMVETDARINETISRVRDIPSLLMRCRDAETRVVELRKRILEPDSLSRAMKTLSQLAAQYHVRIGQLAFSTDSLIAGLRTSSSSFELPLSLTFSGRYLDFGMMLEHLDELPFTIRFTDFNMVREASDEELIIETLARVRMQPASKR